MEKLVGLKNPSQTEILGLSKSRNDGLTHTHGSTHVAGVIAFLLVISTQTVYVKTGSGMVAMLATAALSVIYLLNAPRRLERRVVLFGSLQSTLIILVFALNVIADSSRLTSESLSILLLLSILFPLANAYFDAPDKVLHVLRSFSLIILGEVLLSLLFYGLGQCASIIHPTKTIVAYWGGERLYSSYFGVFFSDSSSPYGILECGRNIGVFAEAPMHAFVILIALFVELFFREKPRILRVVTFGIAIVTTYSTTGMILGIVSIVLWLWSSRAIGGRLLAWILSVPSLLAVAFLLSQKSEFAQMSLDVRSRNFSQALEAFVHSPIFGWGFKASAYSGGSLGHTSVYSQVLSDGGILFLFYVAVPLALCVYSVVQYRERRTFSFFVLLLSAFYSTVITYTPLFVTLLAVSYATFRFDGLWAGNAIDGRDAKSSRTEADS